MTPRIAIIGGGSAYMPGLAFSFARESERLAGAKLALHDIDPDALFGQSARHQGWPVAKSGTRRGPA